MPELPESVEFPTVCTKDFNKACNQDRHVCSPGCEHMAIMHAGHIDYLVPNQHGDFELRHPHGDHADWHGTLKKGIHI